MFSYTVDEIVEAFKKAKNANSALKNFLKREVKPGDPSARWIKDFKDVLSSKAPGAIEMFLGRSLPKYEVHTLVLARYAFPEAVEKISDTIFTTYAEDFNRTYEKKESQVEVKDRQKFDSTISQVVKSIEKGLADQSLPTSGFMKNVLLFWLFDQDVLKEVIPVVKGLA